MNREPKPEPQFRALLVILYIPVGVGLLWRPEAMIYFFAGCPFSYSVSVLPDVLMMMMMRSGASACAGAARSPANNPMSSNTRAIRAPVRVFFLNKGTPPASFFPRQTRIMRLKNWEWKLIQDPNKQRRTMSYCHCREYNV
jgi:hypothetical protein